MKVLFIIYLEVIFCLCISSSAHAYIDPGTGSLLLQALAAGLITCMAFIRGIREKILGLFHRKQKSKDEE